MEKDEIKKKEVKLDEKLKELGEYEDVDYCKLYAEIDFRKKKLKAEKIEIINEVAKRAAGIMETCIDVYILGQLMEKD